jgi:uncharacterized protein (TIGR03000 family)
MKTLLSGTGLALLLLAVPAQARGPHNHGGHGHVGVTFASASHHHNHGHRGNWGYPYYGGIYGGGYGVLYGDPDYGGYGGAPTIINNYYIQGPGQPPIVAQRPAGPGGGDAALLPPPAVPEVPQVNVVRIDVNLPADAELFIQNVKMPQAGTTRRFVSPPLEAGQNYTYAIRVVWKENDRELSETRKLRVRAGDHQSITFLSPPGDMAKAGH